MSLARQFAQPSAITRSQPKAAPAADPVAQHVASDVAQLRQEVEQLRAKVAELSAMILDAPFGPAPTTAQAKPTAKSRAAYYRQYRKRKNAAPARGAVMQS